MNTPSTRISQEWTRADALGLLVTLVIAAAMFFTNIANVGLWEPWESHEIFVAQEYTERGPAPEIEAPEDPSYNWSVPTYEGRPVAVSLLKTWSLAVSVQSLSEIEVGAFERSVRLPFSIALFVMVFGFFVWMRKVYGWRAACVSSIALVTMPAIYIGVHNVSTEMFAVVTSTAVIGGFAQLVYAQKRRWSWAIFTGIAIVLLILDQRLIGFFVVGFVGSAWCVTEVAFESYVRRREGRKPIVGWLEKRSTFAYLAGIPAVLAIGWWLNEPPDDAAFAPHILQLFSVAIPMLLVASGFALGRRTRVGRALIGGPQGFFVLGMAVLAFVVLGTAYADANPTLLDGGAVVGKIPVLAYFLEHEIFGTSLAREHMSFDLWVRQVGFTLVPWVALVPLGLGYLACATRVDDAIDVVSEEQGLRRLMLVWVFFAALVTMVAAVWHHYFFIGYAPLAAGVGIMLADADFWKQVRRQPLLIYAMGFVACAIVVMVGKDLERFPTRFAEVYTVMEKDWSLPEAFSFGQSLKTIKYVTLVVFITHFFGLFSFAVITLRRAKPRFSALVEAGRSLKNREPIDFQIPEQPFAERAEEKEAIRHEDSWIGTIAATLETPKFAPILVVWFTVVAAVFLFDYLPSLTHHTSQQGVFATYSELAEPGERLYRYDIATRDDSVYLEDVPRIQNSREFLDAFDSEERFFAVIPRKSLARINFDVRRRVDRNVPVLYAESSRLLLVSNHLKEGEDDQSFVNEHIFEEPPEIEYPVVFENEEGEEVHPVFDGALEMLGFNLDHEQRDGIAVYGWGQTMVIDYYFRVKKRVPSNQKIFLHVDYPGNRINGDHYPNNGEFPTNFWVPGDIVRSRQHLEVGNYATPGVYSLNFGFFLGSNRMKVEPREAHDGRNRITIGKVRIEPI